MRRLARPFAVAATVTTLVLGGAACGDEADPAGEPAPSDVTGVPDQGDPRGNNPGNAGDAGGTSGAGGAGGEPSTGAGGGGP